MIKNSVTIDEVIDFLNELCELDHRAMYSLVTSRIDCNEKLASHPTVQVGAVEGPSDYQVYNVGMLGILNGLFGIYDDGHRKGWGQIMVRTNDVGTYVKFEKVESKNEAEA